MFGSVKFAVGRWTMVVKTFSNFFSESLTTSQIRGKIPFLGISKAPKHDSDSVQILFFRWKKYSQVSLLDSAKITIMMFSKNMAWLTKFWIILAY